MSRHSRHTPHSDYTLGVASDKYLEAGKLLFHGSLAQKFTHEYPPGPNPAPTHYIHPPHPDGPAWFADNEKFSLHAAIRFTEPGKPADIVLHSYQLKAKLHLMSLPDIDNFRIFMLEQFKVDAPFNGLAEGLELTRRAADTRLDGYALLKDTVRGEPEYVLYPDGLKQLRAYEPRTIHVLPTSKTQSKLVDAVSGKQIATYTYGNGPGVLV